MTFGITLASPVLHLKWVQTILAIFSRFPPQELDSCNHLFVFLFACHFVWLWVHVFSLWALSRARLLWHFVHLLVHSAATLLSVLSCLLQRALWCSCFFPFVLSHFTEFFFSAWFAVGYRKLLTAVYTGGIYFFFYLLLYFCFLYHLKKKKLITLLPELDNGSAFTGRKECWCCVSNMVKI